MYLIQAKENHLILELINFSVIWGAPEGSNSQYWKQAPPMSDLENNVKSWYGQKKIKKVIEKKRFLF